MLQSRGRTAGGRTEARGKAASALDAALECAPGCMFPWTRRGFVSTWEGLAGYPRPGRRGGGAKKCQRTRQEP